MSKKQHLIHALKIKSMRTYIFMMCCGVFTALFLSVTLHSFDLM